MSQSISNYGLTLPDGGSYTNTATLEGVYDGLAAAASATITNEAGGTISGTGVTFVVNSATYDSAGIALNAGGTVVNAGYVSGQNGIILGDTAATGGYVLNSTTGTIMAYTTLNPVAQGLSSGFDGSGVGIYIAGAGTVVNLGTINANHVGVVDVHWPATVINDGLITAANGGYGIYLYHGGSVNNSGSIIGSGQAIFAADTFNITNSGYLTAPDTPFALVENPSYTITAISTAVFGLGTGTVTNEAGGTIVAQYGEGIVVDALSIDYATNSEVFGAANLVNAGLVRAAYGLGFVGIGSVVNSGTVLASVAGVELQDASTIAPLGILLNSGLIQAGMGTVANAGGTMVLGVGVTLTGGYVDNFAGGTIAGDVAIRSTDTAAATHYTSIQSYSNPLYVYNAGLVTAGLAGVFISNASALVINSGTINAADYGVDAHTSATVINSGSINASARMFVNQYNVTTGGAGILLLDGGSVTNAAGGTITGYNGIYTYGAPGTVDNAGFIGGAGTYSAVYLDTGGVVDNSGTIAGPSGVSGATMVTNTGVIESTGGTGFTPYGVDMFAGGTLMNDGLISAASGYAVSFSAGTDNLLVIDAGATFIGAVNGGDLVGGTAAGSSELALATGNGTLANFGAQFSNFQTITFDAGAAWTITDDGDRIATGEVIAGFGLGDTLVLTGYTLGGPATSYASGIGLVLDGGTTLDITGSLATADFLVTSDGTNTTITETLVSGVTAPAGSSETIGAGVTVAMPTLSGGALTLASGGSITGDISFSGTGSTLVIAPAGNGSTTVPTNTITGFAAGDTIELGGVAFVADEDSYTVATAGTVTVDANGTFYNLLIAGAYVGEDNFSLSGDLAITEVTCYAAGTRIRTAHGETPVEDLAIGDLLPTLHAGLQPIKWIGQRRYDGRFIAGNKRALPVCIKASALGLGVPARDLLVSPGHAICLGGGLIHAGDLVNGVSVIQLTRVEEVHYFHIELATHEVIFAENCPAESFMGEVFRAQFHNSAEYQALYPGEAAPAHGCLTRPQAGLRRTAMWGRVARRAGVENRKSKRLLF